MGVPNNFFKTPNPIEMNHAEENFESSKSFQCNTITARIVTENTLEWRS